MLVVEAGTAVNVAVTGVVFIHTLVTMRLPGGRGCSSS